MKIYKNLKSVFLHLVLPIFIFSIVISPVFAQGGGKEGSNGGDTQNSGKGTGSGSGEGITSGIGEGNVKSDDEESLSDMRTVLELFKEKRFGEAVPYLERLVQANPTNKDLRFFYGFSLLMRSAEISNKTESRQLQIQARKELEKAKELGMQNKDLDKIIASLPSGGSSNSNNTVSNNTISSNVNTNRSSATYSSNKDAQEFMQKGEEHFARREYQKAFEMYEKALRKDPNLYEAALFSGDVFLQIGRGFQENDSKRKENFDKAESWYQKAMIINPNRETAYRYSATPLMLTKQFEKARDRYIEAYITEPYNERALGGLRQWAEVTKTEIGHPAIIIPADVVSISNDTEDGSFAWSAYFSTLALWQTSRDGLSEKFKNAYPGEKTYRRSLGERFDALKATVLALKEKINKSDNSVKKLEPSLAMLVKLYDEGLLESYILLAIRDEDVAKDQPNYLKENREKMRQYVAKYVVGND